MKTNNIPELIESGFRVTKLPNFTTIVESDKEFYIKGESKTRQAIQDPDTGKYSVVFEGLCPNDSTPNTIMTLESIEIPLIAQSMFNQHAKEHTQHVDVMVESKFGDLEIGEKFAKTNSGELAYSKIDEHQYVDDNAFLGNPLNLTFTPDQIVYIKESVDLLTPEQKHDIINHMDVGMTDTEAMEFIGMELENIPGLETIDQRMLDKLHTQLLMMYKSR